MHVNVQTPQGPLAIVVTPDAGFMSAASMGVRDLPPPQKSETMQQIHRDMIYIGQHLNDPAFTFTAAGTEKIGDIETRIVDVSGGNMAIRWFVDPKTGHVVQEAYEAVGRSGQMHGETVLSNWQTTDGITLPTVHKNKENGKDSSVVEFTKVQYNPTIDPKLFEKPAIDAKPAQ
jgi:hypothetical protein